MTDLVGSTLLVEALGDVRAAGIFEQVDRLTRDLLEAHGGQEIDRSDGFLLAFDSVDAAIASALDFHVAVAGIRTQSGMRMSYRCAVHTGDVVERENRAEDIARGAKPVEVEGLAKHLTARLMSLAEGGQTLMSQAAADRFTLDGTLRVVDHGTYQCKGIADPVRVFEVGRPGEAPLSPPGDQPKAWRVVSDGSGGWRTVASVPNNLDEPVDRFVGRWTELRALADRLESHALVTLVGTGGAGKTRLSQQYARQHLGHYTGGVWFCDLAAARGPGDILAGLAAALGITLDGSAPADQVAWALASRGRSLLILDNVEQVLDAVEAVVGPLVSAGSGVRILATSREPLEIRGESVLPLGPLRLPPRLATRDQLERNEAVTLFLARARDARGVPLPADQLSHSAEVVRAVDGLPLAIELAAARTRALAPQRLAKELKDRIGILKSNRRGIPDRQLTLTAALDWSWNLLEPEERSILCQLSVFRGTFELDAILAVVEADDPVDGIERLVSKSLVIARIERTGTARYRLYVPVRLYARDRLRTDGEAMGLSLDRLRDRHAAHYATLGSPEHLGQLDLAGGRALRAALHADMANFEAALEHLLQREEPIAAAAAARALMAILDVQGPTQDAAGWAERVLALPGIDPADAIQLALHASRLAWLAGDPSALDRLFQLSGRALMNLDSTLPGRVQQTRHFPTSIMLRPRLLPLVDYDRGEGGDAVRLTSGVASIVERFGDPKSLGRLLANVGVLEDQQDRPEAAAGLYEQAMALHQANRRHGADRVHPQQHGGRRGPRR